MAVWESWTSSAWLRCTAVAIEDVKLYLQRNLTSYRVLGTLFAGMRFDTRTACRR